MSDDQLSQPTPDASGTKKRTVIVIGVIVALVVLCCCTSTGIAAYLYLQPDRTVTTDNSPGPSLDDITNDLPDQEPPQDARLAEWLDWSPEAQELLPTLPERKADIVLEGLALVAPDFAFEDAVWEGGWYEPSEDWYYSDGAYVRATHPSSDRVSAAVELWIQSDEMVAEDVSFEREESEAIATVAGGTRELLYWNQWGNGFELATDGEIALWVQLGVDWPDAVVVNGYPGAGGPDTFEVEFTKWDVFAVATDYPVVRASYSRAGGVWTLTDWEYLAADGSSEIAL